MNNPTQLLPTDLILVEVPEDAFMFKVQKRILSYVYPNPIEHSQGDCNLYADFELLGEVTADSISKELDDFLKY